MIEKLRLLPARLCQNRKLADTLYGIGVVVAFLLCTRVILFGFVDDHSLYSTIYTNLSRICAVIIFLIYLISWKKVPKLLLICIGGAYFLQLLSTVINAGSLRRIISTVYPILAINALAVLNCTTLARAKKFIHVLANMFLVLASANLLLMITAPTLFMEPGATAGNYLLGLENHLGYVLVLGLLFVLLNNQLNSEKWKLEGYIVIFAITMVINFSVGSLMGAAVLLVYLLLPVVRKFFEKAHFAWVLVLFAVVFVAIVIFNKPIFNWAPIRYILVDILGKDVTLTHRTELWEIAFDAIKNRPLLGYGYGETTNVIRFTTFYGAPKLWSTHNQFVQTLYEGGYITFAAFVGVLLTGGVLLAKCENRKAAAVIKLIAFVFMVMYLTEAVGFNALIFTINLGCALTFAYRKEAKIMNKEHDAAVTEEKVSVVIPVYNVEEFLDECLDSVINQTYQNMEIIVVNDGSTDGSYDICLKYAEKDPRITLITQKNGGLSAARNTGIRAATGKYITFIDSDDAIEKDMIAYMYDLLKNNDADMSCCQKTYTDEKGNILPDKDTFFDKVFDGKNACMKALFDDPEVGTWAWAKLYRTEFFEAVCYPEGKYHEDVYTTYLLIAQCNKMVTGKERKYLYRQRGGSIMHATFSPKHLHAVEGNEARAEYIAEHYPELASKARAQIVWACNSCAMKIMNSDVLDMQAIDYLQQKYRKYEAAFLLGSSSILAKIFSLCATVHLKSVLRIAHAVLGIRRKIK